MKILIFSFLIQYGENTEQLLELVNMLENHPLYPVRRRDSPRHLMAGNLTRYELLLNPCLCLILGTIYQDTEPSPSGGWCSSHLICTTQGRLWVSRSDNKGCHIHYRQGTYYVKRTLSPWKVVPGTCGKSGEELQEFREMVLKKVH